MERQQILDQFLTTAITTAKTILQKDKKHPPMLFIFRSEEFKKVADINEPIPFLLPDITDEHYTGSIKLLRRILSITKPRALALVTELDMLTEGCEGLLVALLEGLAVGKAVIILFDRPNENEVNFIEEMDAGDDFIPLVAAILGKIGLEKL